MLNLYFAYFYFLCETFDHDHFSFFYRSINGFAIDLYELFVHEVHFSLPYF